MIWLFAALVIVVFIGWFASEFQARIWLRLPLGVAALGMSYFVAVVVGALSQLSYNASYGTTSANLIETVIANVEKGNQEELLRELKRLKEKFHPTYENRANYDTLVSDFVETMKGSSSDKTDDSDN